MKKIVIYEELSYVLGLVFLSLGTTLMKISDFGLSMIVAPAYILHVKISQYLPFFSFGMSGYVVQFFLIIILCLIVRKFKHMYLISFLTAVVYGFVLDGTIYIFSKLPSPDMLMRVVYFLLGMPICSLGIAFFFRTYIAPAAYDLFVKEIADVYKVKKINKIKTIYDCSYLVVSVILSLILFGFTKPVGIGVGTIACALFNGFIIGVFARLFDRFFYFKRLLFKEKR